MKIFIYEFSCSADPVQYPMACLLRAEGAAMLSAVVEDFGRLPGVEILSLCSERRDEERRAFQNLARAADFCLVIAPESQNILSERSYWVEQVRGKLLGSSSAAIDLAGDKLRLADSLTQRNIPTPPTRLINANERAVTLPFPVVLKPRRGAGSQECYLLTGSAELWKRLAYVQSISKFTDFVLQPYVSGRAASVALLVGGHDCFALLPASQELSTDGRFRYLGGRIPLEKDLGNRAVSLARRAIQRIPGLSGYVGVDVVLGEPSDGSQDYVIEINPRLTTSYVGLRALAEGNLAKGILCAASGENIPKMRWRAASVRFWADGRIELSSQDGIPGSP
jgi:tyramine---L-glutamate ligase